MATYKVKVQQLLVPYKVGLDGLPAGVGADASEIRHDQYGRQEVGYITVRKDQLVSTDASTEDAFLTDFEGPLKRFERLGAVEKQEQQQADSGAAEGEQSKDDKPKATRRSNSK